MTQVKFSTDARQDIREHVKFLTGKTVSGIASFNGIVKRARGVLEAQPNAGHAESAVSIKGALRILVDGWRFDYDILDGVVVIQRITSSVNTPMQTYDDDFDYEDQDELRHGR